MIDHLVESERAFSPRFDEAAMGHEHFPPATWDLVVAEILRHTERG